MNEKIMKMLGVGTLYLAASLFFASLLMGGYLWYAWGMNRARLVKAIAIAQGFDIYDTEEKIRDEVLRRETEIRHKDILNERTMRDLNKDLGGKASQEALGQIQAVSESISKDRAEIATLQASLKKQLDELEKNAKSDGIKKLTTIYESIEAENAKKYIQDMVQTGEYVKVIAVFNKMDPKKRAKIINEFQEDAEFQEMAKVLRKIGSGEPQTELVEAMRAEAEKLKQTPR